MVVKSFFRKLLPWAVFMAFSGVYAQQDAHFSHYMFNDMYFNAGYAGIEDATRATLIHRSQWLGYEGTLDDGGAPTTQMLTVSHPLRILGSYTTNSGVGLMVTNDRLGPWRILNVKGAFAYHIKLKNGATLGTGLRIGLFNQGIDGSVLRAVDQNDDVVDQLIASGTNNQLKPDVDLGVYYNTRKYYAGISISHLTASQFQFGSDIIASTLARHLYINGGYRIRLGQNLEVVPSAVIQTDFSETSFNYGAVANINKFKYWGGLTLRQSLVNRSGGEPGKKLANDDLVLLVGIGLLQNNALRIGYSFDIVTTGASAKDNTSHEFMLSYVLPISREDKLAPVRTPRYRKVN